MKKRLLSIAILLAMLLPTFAQQPQQVQQVDQVSQVKQPKQVSQKLYKGVELLALEEYAFKGLTSFVISARLRNKDKVDYKVEGGHMVLHLAKDTVAVMSQIGVAVLEAGDDGSEATSTLWSVEKIDPMNLMMLMMQLSQQSYEGLNISYRVDFTEGKKRREYYKKHLDIEKILTIFAPAF